MAKTKRHYLIEHPLIGRGVIEYDIALKNPKDLTGKLNTVGIERGDLLLFKLELSNYVRKEDEDTPVLAQVMAYKKNLIIFEKCDQCEFKETTPEKARELVRDKNPAQ
jgi:hypothetical protein